MLPRLLVSMYRTSRPSVLQPSCMKASEDWRRSTKGI